MTYKLVTVDDGVDIYADEEKIGHCRDMIEAAQAVEEHQKKQHD